METTEQQPAEQPNEPKKPREKGLSDEDIKRVATEIAQQIKQTQPPQPKNIFNSGQDILTSQKSIQSDYMQAAMHDENVSLLNTYPPFGQSVEEAMATEAYARRGILKAWEAKHKKRGLPWNILAITAVAIAVIYAFSNNKELWLQAGAFFDDPMNKLYTIIVAVIIVIALYIIFKRRRRRNYA